MADAKKRVRVVREIAFDDCRENFISYSEDKQTFLYINQEDQIIERNRNGEITDNVEVIKYNNLYYFDYAAGQSNEIVNGCAHSLGGDMYWIQPEKIYFISYEE